MGRAIVARLGLGLLLLALLLPTQIYSISTTSVTATTNSSSSWNTSTTVSPTATTSGTPVTSGTSSTATPNATTSKGNGGPLQCTASLLVVSISLLHLYC